MHSTASHAFAQRRIARACAPAHALAVVATMTMLQGVAVLPPRSPHPGQS